MSKKSWIPDVLPIARIEDHHTHYLGQCADGKLFWGYFTFAFEAPPGRNFPGSDWQEFRREYAVLHLFDDDGNYLKTHHWYGGKTSECDQADMEEKLKAMVSALGPVEFEDIYIKPFQTEIDGITFGLIPNDEYETIDLEPSDTISFHEPWNGEYDT